MRLQQRYFLIIGTTAFVLFALQTLLFPVYQHLLFNNAISVGGAQILRYNENTIKDGLMPSNQKLPISNSIHFAMYSNGKTRLALHNISADMFRANPNLLTGNSLIDDYGKNDMSLTGENGRGVVYFGEEKRRTDKKTSILNINVMASDIIPLNRMVPDARFRRCRDMTYPADLPTASVIIPFYDEWPSVLLRTVYSVVNRTPRHLLRDIILIDDASTMAELNGPLDRYIENAFPKGLVRLVHMKTRSGLIQARLAGWKISTADVIVFFDSHMEVNIDWLQPLVQEIKKDRKTVAMGVLDYIDRESFLYKFNEEYMTRYGFDWRLVFFETFFRDDQIESPTAINPRIGATMVGAAFAIDRMYFGEIGAYDEGMRVWGGENLEFSWRVWMCGGRLVHLPCSHFGHIPRGQPYEFPGGRHSIEMHNYKRAAVVWMGDFKKFVYDYYPGMDTLDVGSLKERIDLKERLQCKNFTWYVDNIWPELLLFDRKALAWGSIINIPSDFCLDNNDFLFSYPEPLQVKKCHHKLASQGFTWALDKRLKTSLQCLVVPDLTNPLVKLQTCINLSSDTWDHDKHTHAIKHIKSGLCLETDNFKPVLKMCNPGENGQQWRFQYYVS